MPETGIRYRKPSRTLSCRNLYSTGLEYSPNLDIYAKHLKTEKQVLLECISYNAYVLVEPARKARYIALIKRWQARIEDIDAQLSVLEKVRP